MIKAYGLFLLIIANSSYYCSAYKVYLYIVSRGLPLPNFLVTPMAVKEALKKAGIEVEVRHGMGMACGWLEINIAKPGQINIC